MAYYTAAPACGCNTRTQIRCDTQIMSTKNRAHHNRHGHTHLPFPININKRGCKTIRLITKHKQQTQNTLAFKICLTICWLFYFLSTWMHLTSTSHLKSIRLPQWITTLPFFSGPGNKNKDRGWVKEKHRDSLSNEHVYSTEGSHSISLNDGLNRLLSTAVCF